MRPNAGDRLNTSTLGALLLTLLLGGPTSDSPVADAAEEGRTEEVRRLLRQGADVNAAQGDGMTALHWAAVRDDGTLVELLVYAGANLEATTRLGGYAPLHLAARKSNARAVAALVDAGADVRVETDTGLGPLHYAAAAGSVDAVRTLLDGGAEIDAPDAESGRTPLIFATALNRLAVVQHLIAAGADVSRTTTVKDFAARAEQDGPERQRRNRLIQAMKEAERSAEPEEETEEPARPAAPPTATTQEDEPAKAEQAKGDEAKEAEKETEAKEEPDEPDEPDEKEPREDESRATASTRATPRAMGYDDLVGRQGGLTALHYAARDGRMQAAEMLLAAGELDRPTEGDRTTPLLIATINGNYDLAMVLLARGADPNLASDDGAAPLYATLNNRWAPKSLYPQPTAFKQQETSYLELMRALLDAGADVNKRLDHHIWYSSFNFDLLGVSFQGATPFWRAAYALDVPAMELLAEYGADPNIPTTKPAARRRGRGGGDGDDDPSGLPPVPVGGPAVYPIHAATGVGYGTSRAGNSHRHAPDAWLPAVKYLVEVHGADVNRRDHDGYSPVHHAAARGDNEVIEYLVGRGADVTFVSRRGQTTVDMANGPQQRVQPFPETIALLEGLGAKNNDNCLSC